MQGDPVPCGRCAGNGISSFRISNVLSYIANVSISTVLSCTSKSAKISSSLNMSNPSECNL